MTTVKETGIVFRHGDHPWFAPMSGAFICRGAIRALADPDETFVSMRQDQLLLVDAEDAGQSIRFRQKGILSVSFEGELVSVADMIRDPRTLEILQNLIFKLTG